MATERSWRFRVDASVTDVWALLADHRCCVLWNPSVTRSTLVHGHVADGTAHYRAGLQVPGRTLGVEVCTTTFTAGRQVGWRTTHIFLRMDERLTVHPRDDGATDVRYDLAIALRGAAAVAGGMVGPVMDRAALDARAAIEKALTARRVPRSAAA